MPSIESIIEDPIANYPRATVACFDPTLGDLPRRQLDAPRMIEFLSRLDEAGADGLLIGASTGQGHLRTSDELGDWFAAANAADVQAVLMGLLRPEDGPNNVQRHARILADSNYKVGFVRPGNDVSATADAKQIADNMLPAVRAIANVGLAVGLYSIPDVSGFAMPVDSVAHLLGSEVGERIVAVKVTEADYASSTQKFFEDSRLSRLKIVQGWDPHLARALQDGGKRVGVTSGPMSFAVFQYRYLLDAAERGDWSETLQAQQAVTVLFESMQDDPTRFADLQRAKYIMGLGHPLTGVVESEQIDRVLRALETIDRDEDRRRLALSLDLMKDGPFRDRLQSFA